MPTRVSIGLDCGGGKVSAQLEHIARVNQRATDTLVKELGVVDTIRFLNQFRAGSGDYTVQRNALLQGLSVADITAQIRVRRAGA